MKKLFGILVAAVLVLGIAGQSMAALTDYDLIRVVYQRGGSVEVVTDLGTLSAGGGTINLSAENKVLGGGSAAFTPAMFGGTSWSDINMNNLYVAYFVNKAGPAYDAWLSGPVGGSQTYGSMKYSSFNNAVTQVYGYYNGLGITDGGTVSGAESAGGSYWTRMDKTGTSIGLFSGAITGGNGEISLAALLTDGYVEQSLYYYNLTATNAKTDGTVIASIRTTDDGATILNYSSPSPVPVPPALLLFAPGLLALAGLRKKLVA